MKKIFLGILLCLAGNSLVAMEDTITFESDEDNGYNPIAIPVTQISDSQYQANDEEKSVLTTNHPFTLVMKEQKNPLANPELGILVYTNNGSKKHYVVTLGYVYEFPEAYETALGDALISIKQEEPVKIEKSQSKILPYIFGMPIVGFAIYGGYEAMQKAKAWYAKNPNFFQEKSTQLLQKIKQLRHSKTAV